MKLAVTDANIFIDLFHIELVDGFFALEIEVYTTLEVIDELDDDQKVELIHQKRLKILEVDDIHEVERFGKELSSGLSFADLSVFYHANILKTGILTGDSLLRKQAKNLGFDVHGVLWILNKMVDEEIEPAKTAIEKLMTLMSYNKRLPTKECQKLLNGWKLIVDSVK